MSTALNYPDAPVILPLQKGKYVFINNLFTSELTDNTVPDLYAEALQLSLQEGTLYGDRALTGLHELISRQSVFITEDGQPVEAHKLYTWPRNLGSTAEWTACKQDFLQAHVLNYPLEVLSVQDNGGLTWTYITPENFKDFPDDLPGSAGFREFAKNRKEYFFLRRPLRKIQ